MYFTNISNSCLQPESTNSNLKSYEQFSFLVGGCLTTTLVILGIFGNFYSVTMLKKFSIAPALYYYLGTLAIWDSLLLISSFAYLSLGCLIYGTIRQCSILAPVQRVFHPISNTTRTASVWLIVLIAIERFRAVSDPIKHRIRDHKRGTKLICLIASFGAILYSAPAIFEVTLISCLKCDPKTNRTYPISGIGETSLRQSAAYQFVYRLIAALIFESLVPFVLILVLTIRILRLLRAANKTRSKLQPCTGGRLPQIRSPAESNYYRNREAGSTVMLLLILVKFLTCHIPTILNLWEILVKIQGKGQSVTAAWAFTYSVDISNFLVILNSATNWIIYFKWRNVLKGQSKWNPTGAALLATFSQLLVQPGSMLVIRDYNPPSSARFSKQSETITLSNNSSPYHKKKTQLLANGSSNKVQYGSMSTLPVIGRKSDTSSYSELISGSQLTIDEKCVLLTTSSLLDFEDSMVSDTFL